MFISGLLQKRSRNYEKTNSKPDEGERRAKEKYGHTRGIFGQAFISGDGSCKPGCKVQIFGVQGIECSLPERKSINSDFLNLRLQTPQKSDPIFLLEPTLQYFYLNINIRFFNKMEFYFTLLL